MAMRGIDHDQIGTGIDQAFGPGKPRIAWDDQAARDALITALVSDALAVVAAFRDNQLGEGPAQALALLALIAGQDVEPADDDDGTSGRWRIARRVAPGDNARSGRWAGTSKTECGIHS